MEKKPLGHQPVKKVAFVSWRRGLMDGGGSLTSRRDVQCFSCLLHFWLAASDLVALVWVVIIDLYVGVWKSFLYFFFFVFLVVKYQAREE